MVLAMFLDNSPPDFWHDPLVLTIIGGIIVIAGAIVGSVITVWYTRRDNVKRLVYFVRSDVHVLRKDIGKRMKVTFDDNQIEDPRLLEVDVWNAGNSTIDHGDFRKPVVFSFPNQVKVLDAEIISTIPSDSNVTLTSSSNDIKLEPTLFNKNDRVSIRLLVSGSGNLSVHSRIAGVHDIVDYDKVRRSGDLFWTVISLVCIVINFIFFTSFAIYASTRNTINTSPVRSLDNTEIILLVLAALGLISYTVILTIRGFSRRKLSREEI